MYVIFLDNLARMEPIDLHNWLINRRLIPDNKLCKHCGLAMAIRLAKHASDGFNWRCKNSEYGKYKTSLSIQTDSWLADFSIPMKSIIKAVNLWAKERLFADIKQDVNISGPVFLIGKIMQTLK